MIPYRLCYLPSLICINCLKVPLLIVLYFLAKLNVEVLDASLNWDCFVETKFPVCKLVNNLIRAKKYGYYNALRSVTTWM